jgi:hypothetical protein
MKKKIYIIGLSLILLFSHITLAQNLTNSQTNTLTIDIPQGSLNHQKTIYGDEIIINSFGKHQIPGQPQLPTKIFSIAIPPGAIFTNLEYTTKKITTLPGQYTLHPCPPPQISDKTNNLLQCTQQQIYTTNYETTYNTNNPYPTSIVKYEGTSGFRKYNLINIRINPIVYHPQTKTLTYYEDITIHIQYIITQTIDPQQNIYDNEDIFEKQAQKLILNYETIQHWYPKEQTNQENYEYVIITLDSLTPYIQPLINWEETKGYNVKIVNLSWINSHYTGYDSAEKIRNFLREKYPTEQWGIQYLLIIGHQDDIPMRETWQDAGSGKAETDFYYAELSLPDNQSWDADEDHQYGEDTDPIDFFGEINVGRIPWSDPTTVQHICEKSVAYEQNNDPSFKNNILLIAASIDSNTDGAVFMEFLANNDIHPWMSHWMKTRIYEALSPYPKDYILTHQNVVNTWSNGKYAFVSWHAHGSPQGTDFININDCQYLNDNYPAIISAASCSNSDTNYLNIGQAMMQQGGIGFLGANKVAYYRSNWDDPTDGSDQSFKYFFKKHITSGNLTQGQAHQYAISQMYQQGLWNYPRYETFIHGSLWGNPNLGITSYTINDPPAQPKRPQGPINGKIRVKHTYTSINTDPSNEHLYYLFDWDDESNSGWLGPFPSNETVEAAHIWTQQNSYEIRVITQDINGTLSEWSEPLPINMPKNTFRNYQSFIQIFQNLLKNHLHLFRVLKNLLLLIS